MSLQASRSLAGPSPTDSPLALEKTLPQSQGPALAVSPDHFNDWQWPHRPQHMPTFGLYSLAAENHGTLLN